MRRLLFALISLVLLATAMLFWLGLKADRAPHGRAPLVAPHLTDPVQRGAYLTVMGNCRACHTAAGGTAYAGGRRIATQFGDFYSPNITPDKTTGIGSWTSDDFWRAMHEGRGKDGAFLYPVFPFPHYTRLSRVDTDAIFAYLMDLPAHSLENQSHQISFPFNQRWLMLIWRALYFRPGVYEMDAAQSPEWNLGAYLGTGLAHCASCHSPRNALGAAVSDHRSGGGVALGWYAPALDADREAGVASWSEPEIIEFLQSGRTSHAAALGPMAEVVFESTQHWSTSDLQALAKYLQSMPDQPAMAPQRRWTADLDVREQRMFAGSEIYAEHCAGCHGDAGIDPSGDILALDGNRAVTMASSINPIRTVLYGGYGPGTRGNPQPYGMPPFHMTLSDTEIANVLSFVRGSWNNQAGPVSEHEVRRQRTGPLW